jgi:hypothetical protein
MVGLVACIQIVTFCRHFAVDNISRISFLIYKPMNAREENVKGSAYSVRWLRCRGALICDPDTFQWLNVFSVKDHNQPFIWLFSHAEGYLPKVLSALGEDSVISHSKSCTKAVPSLLCMAVLICVPLFAAAQPDTNSGAIWLAHHGFAMAQLQQTIPHEFVWSNDIPIPIQIRSIKSSCECFLVLDFPPQIPNSAPHCIQPTQPVGAAALNER